MGRKQNARLKKQVEGTTGGKRDSVTKKKDFFLEEADIPPPPPEDGAEWREKQENESMDPPGFVRPPRWGDWLQVLFIITLAVPY